jgi:hypothetical protein
MRGYSFHLLLMRQLSPDEISLCHIISRQPPPPILQQSRDEVAIIAVTHVDLVVSGWGRGSFAIEEIHGEQASNLMLGDIGNGKFFYLPVNVLDLRNTGDAALFLHLLRTLLLAVDRLLPLNFYPLTVLYRVCDVLVNY